MEDENYLLISLKDHKSKKLAQVISNDTSRKILEILAKKDATETEISKELNIPLSTAHYNIQALLDTGIVKSEEFHYSEKGKEVNHYSLANKVIIITPSGTDKMKQAIKNILPIGLVGVLASGTLFLLNNLSRFRLAGKSGLVRSFDAAKTSTKDLLSQGATSQNFLPSINKATTGPDIAVWFLLGTLFSILVMLIIEWVRNKKKRK